MESTIVSTSVVAITNGLGGYVKSSWLFTSYMLTFSGNLFLLPVSFKNMADVYGRLPNNLGQSFGHNGQKALLTGSSVHLYGFFSCLWIGSDTDTTASIR